MIKAIARGVGWLSSSAFLQAGLNLAAIAVLARLLSPAEFGIAALVMIVVGLATPVAQMGLGQAFVRCDEQTIYSTALLVTLFFTLPASLTTFVIVVFLPSLSAELVWIAVLASLVVFVRAIASISEALLFRLQRFRVVAFSEVAGQLAFLGVATYSASVGVGATALVLGYVAQSLMRYIICLAGSLRLPFSFQSSQVRPLMHFGFGYTLARSGNIVAKEVDKIMVGAKLGAEVLGLYSRAHHLAVMAPTLLGQVVSRVLYPIFSSARADASMLFSNYHRITILAVFLGSLAAIWGAVLSPQIVWVLLGPDWLEISEAFRWLLLGVPARLAYKMADPVLKTFGRVYLKALLQWAYAALAAALVFAGAQFGLTGVAIGAVAAVCVHCVTVVFVACRCLDQSRRRSSSLAALTIVAVCIVAMVPGGFSVSSPFLDWQVALGSGMFATVFLVLAFWSVVRRSLASE